ncbi:MAG: glycosyltransferase family 39 protein [Coraliomargaritaceae bacterium]
MKQSFLTDFSHLNLNRLLWLWSGWHLVVWTLLPLVCNTCLPLDSIEAVLWGSEWQWGYDKHPPLSGWLAELFTERLGDAGVYLLSQLCVVSAGWGIYRLGLLLKLDANQSILAVLLLECIHFYTYSSVEFNVNILQLPFWAWGWYLGIHGLKTGKWLSWIGLGLCVGLGALTKYIAVFMLIPLFAYWWSRSQLARVFRKLGLWLAGLVSLLVFAPHLLWMRNNDWVTLNYGLRRTGGDASNWLDHIWHPLEYVLTNAVIFLPLVLVSWFAKARQDGIRKKAPRGSLALFTSVYIFMTLLSVLTGMKPVSMWAVPLPLAIGLWLVPRYSLRRSRRYVYRAVVIMGLLATVAYVIVFGISSSVREKPHRVNYPGQAIASAVESAWSRAYAKELDYVVADEWLGGIVNHYGRNEASVMIRGMLSRSAYLDEEMVRASGAVVLWRKSYDASDGKETSLEQIFPDLRARFPEIEEQEDLVIPWPRRLDEMKGRYGLAFIPAQS